MSQKRQKQLVYNIVDYIDKKFGHIGFTRYGNSERHFRWLRKWNWKTDMVDLYNRSSSIIVNFTVMPPPVSKTINLGCESVFLLAGYGMGSLDYPMWPWSYKAFEEKVCQAIDKGSSWFDQFCTPAGCMTYVKEHALRPDVPQIAHCEAYFKTLPPEAHAGQPLKESLIDPEDSNIKDNYEYIRSMFDRGYHKPLPPAQEYEDD